MTEAGYTSRQAIRITGLSQRQLRYWRQTGLISPSQSTQGGHARYTFTDLIALKAAKRLIDAGASVQRIRHCLASLNHFLPTLKEPLAEISLVVTGDVVLVFKSGAAFDALTGQEWIFPVAELARELQKININETGKPLQGELFSDVSNVLPNALASTLKGTVS